MPAGTAGCTSSSPTDTSSPNGPRRIRAVVVPRRSGKPCGDLGCGDRCPSPGRKRGVNFDPRRHASFDAGGCRSFAEFPLRRWQACDQARRFRMQREHVPKLRGQPCCACKTSARPRRKARMKPLHRDGTAPPASVGDTVQQAGAGCPGCAGGQGNGCRPRTGAGVMPGGRRPDCRSAG